MFRGNITATIDAKGRLKIPTSYRKVIEEKHKTNSFFITSIHGTCAQIYPLPVWEEIEKKVLEPPIMKPEKQKFLGKTSYWGREAEMDDQGRVVIHNPLRDHAQLEGEVAVLGKGNYLEVWLDRKYFQEKIVGEVFTDQEMEALGV